MRNGHLAGIIHQRPRCGHPIAVPGQSAPQTAVGSQRRRTAPLPPMRLDELSITSSGPEVSHGRTSRDVLTDVFEEVPVGPTAAQPYHDPAATHDHRRRHLDEQQPPGRRLPFSQRVLATAGVLILLSRRACQRLHGYISFGSRRRTGDLPTQPHQQVQGRRMQVQPEVVRQEPRKS